MAPATGQSHLTAALCLILWAASLVATFGHSSAPSSSSIGFHEPPQNRLGATLGALVQRVRRDTSDKLKKEKEKSEKSEKREKEKSRNKRLLAECLAAHNKFRHEHGVPDLQWDEKIAEFAQKRSNHIAASDGAQFGHPPDLPFGENLFWHSSADTACEKMVRGWYDEIGLYDFKAPTFAPATGHFTQLIWRSTNKVGCAFANSSGERGGVYLTCNYDPPGNFVGEFTDNVPRLLSQPDSLEAKPTTAAPRPSSSTSTSTTKKPRPHKTTRKPNVGVANNNSNNKTTTSTTTTTTTIATTTVANNATLAPALIATNSNATNLAPSQGANPAGSEADEREKARRKKKNKKKKKGKKKNGGKKKKKQGKKKKNGNNQKPEFELAPGNSTAATSTSTTSAPIASS